MINTESKVNKAEYFALKVWASKTVNTTDFVYIALVVNLKTNKQEIRTIG